jgi:hypothetical protein
MDVGPEFYQLVTKEVPMKVSNKLMAAGVLSAGTFLGAVGGSALSSQLASAASTTDTTATTTAATPTASPPPQGDPSKGGHTANGKTEEVLTGDNATKAKAAAEAAEPGATVLRAETDAEGAAYEVHMTKSDGSQVTVKLDSNFKVTSTEDGM